MTSSWIVGELATYGPECQDRAPVGLLTAENYCRQLARRHYENFTVAHRLLPRPIRQHFCHLYAYCRWADDLADEAPPGQSAELLDWWQRELDQMYAGAAWHPVFVALRTTVQQFGIPRQPLADLLVAFRQDQTITRYKNVNMLLDYCRHSANPVGRLVLHLVGSTDAEHFAWSDSICTGLQWANFCQDVARDWDRGRIYLPQESLEEHGCTAASWEQRQADQPFRRCLESEVARAESMLLNGAPLMAAVNPVLQRQVQLFINGGLTICQAIRAQQFDVWTRRPRVSRWQKLRLLLFAPAPEKLAGQQARAASQSSAVMPVSSPRESA